MTESIKQPEAKRLADELERPVGTQSTYSAMQQAAAELRRLHAEVERLRAELSATTERLENRAGTVQALCAETVRLEVERDEARALVETQIIRLDNAHQALVNVRAQRDKAERERDEALIEAKQWENSALAIEVERDEARAELARLTTLRPASEHDGVAEVLWWGDGEFRYIGNEGDDWLCWTTLPDVKETK